MTSLAALARVFRNTYDPPIRGLASKRKRIRKKAEKALKLTVRGMLYETNPLISKIPEGAVVWRSRAVSLPFVGFGSDN